MKWTLKSGREMRAGVECLTPGDRGGVFVGLGPVSQHGSWQDPNELTPAERLEIAAAVKACWDRWAETGEP